MTAALNSRFSAAATRASGISYADRVYREFDESELHPYHRAPDLGQVLDDLSRSGIAVNIDALPQGGGYAFSLGNSANAEGFAESIFDLILGLCAHAIEHFPDSKFAAQHRGTTL